MDLTENQKQYLIEILKEKSNDHDVNCEFDELKICNSIISELEK